MSASDAEEEEECAVQDLSPVKARTTVSKWWRLVWCHERCYKKEFEPLRKLVSSSLQDAGGGLVCMKSAARFTAWAAKPKLPPYVLLSGWREIKPCMQTLVQRGAYRPPAMIIVFPEQVNHYERVVSWAQQLAAQDFKERVHLLQDVQELLGLLPTMTCYCGGAVATRREEGPGVFGRGPFTAEAPALPATGGWPPRAAHRARPRAAVVRAAQGLGAHGGWSAAPLPAGGEAPATEPSVMVRVLAHICPSEDREALKDMLLAALPARYED